MVKKLFFIDSDKNIKGIVSYLKRYFTDKIEYYGLDFIKFKRNFYRHFDCKCSDYMEYLLDNYIIMINCEIFHYNSWGFYFDLKYYINSDANFARNIILYSYKFMPEDVERVKYYVKEFKKLIFIDTDDYSELIDYLIKKLCFDSYLKCNYKQNEYDGISRARFMKAVVYNDIVNEKYINDDEDDDKDDKDDEFHGMSKVVRRLLYKF